MDSKFDDFYVRFEEHFRGSRADIKERQAVYLGCLNLLNRSDALREILDIGSGRGEWLELLRDEGWRAYGRDLNEEMVHQCRVLDLDVECQDALDHLRSLPDGALTAVTGFHIVEHVPFEVLLELFAETLRVLKPGGMIIFETPNPENLQVGAHTFYLDPTHRRPLAPSLLKFVAENTGFTLTGILRLHPYPELGFSSDSNSPIEQHAAKLFFGPQDYSLIAVKDAGDDSNVIYTKVAEMISTLNQHALRTPISLGEALRDSEARAQQTEIEAEARVQQAEAQVQQAEAQVQQAEAQVQQAEARVQQAEAQVQQAEAQVQQAEAQVQQAEAQVQQAEAQAQQAEAQVQQAEARVQQAEAQMQQTVARAEAAESWNQALLNSLSWRITGPFRAIASLVLYRPERMNAITTNNSLNKAMRAAIESIKLVPGVMRLADYCQHRWPGPWTKLMSAIAPITPVPPMSPVKPVHNCESINRDELTPRARQIYHQLKSATERHNKGNS